MTEKKKKKEEEEYDDEKKTTPKNKLYYYPYHHQNQHYESLYPKESIPSKPNCSGKALHTKNFFVLTLLPQIARSCCVLYNVFMVFFICLCMVKGIEIFSNIKWYPVKWTSSDHTSLCLIKTFFFSRTFIKYLNETYKIKKRLKVVPRTALFFCLKYIYCRWFGCNVVYVRSHI